MSQNDKTSSFLVILCSYLIISAFYLRFYVMSQLEQYFIYSLFCLYFCFYVTSYCVDNNTFMCPYSAPEVEHHMLRAFYRLLGTNTMDEKY